MGSASSGVRRQHHHHDAVAGRISRPVPRPRTSGAVLAVAEAPPLVVTDWLERSVNLLLAILALLLLSPVLMLIALAIKLTSRGPVLYTQERVGLDRRIGGPTAAIPSAGATSAASRSPSTSSARCGSTPSARAAPCGRPQNDPRVTPVGRLLRQYRLDEIPQLLNVLRGEMNIVGPRPERPTIFAELREPHRRVPAAPAGQAGDHGAGPDQPPLRPLAGRRAHQGELRPGVHPPPEPAGGPAHHAQDPPRRPLPPRRLVEPERRAASARRCASSTAPHSARIRVLPAAPAPSRRKHYAATTTSALRLRGRRGGMAIAGRPGAHAG